MPVPDSKGNRPLQMTFEEHLRALVYFHLEEHHSAQHLLQVLTHICRWSLTLPSPSYLVRNHYSYCFRMNVPMDLQPFIGKKELRYSLKTGYLAAGLRSSSLWNSALDTTSSSNCFTGYGSVYLSVTSILVE